MFFKKLTSLVASLQPRFLERSNLHPTVDSPKVITETLQRRPELAPGVVNGAVPANLSERSSRIAGVEGRRVACQGLDICCC